MTTKIATALLALSLATFSAPAFAEDQPGKEIQISVSDAYIPGGFDRNSAAYVVTTGMFSNGCYRWSRAEVAHLPDRVHEVKNFARVQAGLCLMVLVPYTKEVSLGKLEPGEHKIRFVNADGTFFEKALKVE